ncbi:MAG: hypothetical protein LQ345_002670 [Seirophora villosa]|nr:MAG: hypothetical protein LQ345_002670 [Seirophora villosa]
MPQLPFLLHIIVEFPASIAFFLHPSMTLPQRQAQAHAVIRQYALLLMASNLIAYAFVFRPADGRSASVAAALAIYHLGPLIRAGSRVRGRGAMEREGRFLSNTWVHLIAHFVCLVSLVYEATRAV